MEQYTISELAKLSGVTIRTLHYYDELGLLKPRTTGMNGYRYYGDNELRRLQHILFHREVGIALKSINALLDKPDDAKALLLRDHRKVMEERANQTAELIETLGRRIAELEGNSTMNNTALYKGLSPEKQTEYEEWLREHLGTDIEQDVNRSRAAFAKLDEAGQAATLKELEEIETALAEAMSRGIDPADTSLDMPLNRHRAWIAYMWAKPCSPEAYTGLANTYLAHPDFKKRYETIAEGFTEYITTAMKEYAERVSSN